jgi:4-carboxymuconolactone decarboxylase
MGPRATDEEERVTDDRYERGLQRLREVQGDDADEAVLRAYGSLDPDFARYAVEAGWADVYGRPGLTLAQRQLLNIAALTTLGAEPQLAAHVRGALNVGVTPREIVEAVFHLVLYAGHPRVLNAFGVVREVFAERGIALPLPRAEAAGES